MAAGTPLIMGCLCTMRAMPCQPLKNALLTQVLPNAAISYAAYSYFKELIAGKAA